MGRLIRLVVRLIANLMRVCKGRLKAHIVASVLKIKINFCDLITVDMEGGELK